MFDLLNTNQLVSISTLIKLKNTDERTIKDPKFDLSSLNILKLGNEYPKASKDGPSIKALCQSYMKRREVETPIALLKFAL